jgi:hypothetical protein
MLLHGRVGAVQEGSIGTGSINGLASHSLRSGWYAPCGSAGLGGLAEEEAELLQALGEDVLARHGGLSSAGVKGMR